MKEQEYEIIDWEISVKLAAGREELAKELLQHFVEALPQSIEKIQAAYQKNDHSELARVVHHLHGACCYCGLPRLKKAIYQLENLLLSEQLDELEARYNTVHNEIDKVFMAHQSFLEK